MAHLNLPVSFEGSVELFTSVHAKDAADGVSSVIRILMTEQDIVLADDLADVNAALSIHKNFLKKEKDAEKHSAERNVLFNPRFKELRACVQFLKSLYKKNVHKLGDWKITVNGENRIAYPAGFELRKKLLIDFLDVHDGFAPGTSPLQPFIDENEIDTAQMRTDADDAEAAHDAFEQENKDKENFRLQRDNLIEPVEDHLRNIGSYLMKLFPSNTRKAGDWGYEVNDKSKTLKERKYIIAEQSQKVVYGSIIGSTAYNLGTTVLEIYAGESITGTPVSVNPSEAFVIKRRYGTFTVKNPGNLGNGQLKATVRK
jgi:hypothetical protein